MGRCEKQTSRVSETCEVLSERMQTLTRTQTNWYQRAWWLSLFTLGYMLLEGVVSTLWGAHDESLTLFGFGVDSFIEVISAIGVAYMIYRIQRNPHTSRAPFETSALRITGWCLYALAAGLTLIAAVNIYTAHKPETTMSGIVISLVSIGMMWLLMQSKLSIGRKLESEPIIADANCTRVCLYMSLVLLAASVIYQVTGIGYVDSLGTLGLVYFSFKEGREALDKASGKETCECD